MDPDAVARDISTPERRWARSRLGIAGFLFLAFMFLACVVTLPWTMARIKPAGVGADQQGTPRYAWQEREARHLPPTWWPFRRAPEVRDRENLNIEARARTAEARARNVATEALEKTGWTPTPEQLRAARPFYVLGTDLLGRDVFVRCLAGGGVSLTIGLLAAAIAVLIGTVYGAVAGYVGGRVDAVMMRIVDVLYGLPYVLLVVLVAVAVDAVVDRYVSRSDARAAHVMAAARQTLAHELRTPSDSESGGAERRGGNPTAAAVRDALDARPELRDSLEQAASAAYPRRTISETGRLAYDLGALLVAIGGVSWLTMARVIRGQVLSLKSQPFVEAARAVGSPTSRIFFRHLLPNLVGPIIVYATLTVPQAILQESFLSFLGIGVKPPAPSWGNLAAEGIADGINPHRLSDSRWWLLVFPCVLLGCTLLALNFLGEGLRAAMDPKRKRR